MSGFKALLGEELKEKNDASYQRKALSRQVRTAEGSASPAQIVQDVVSLLECGEESVSLAIEEIKPGDWAEKVYKPDILNNPEKLYKKPGYNPFE